MSLFDVIKYPISDIPTMQELSALPEDLFDNWVLQTKWYRYDYLKNPVSISDWYSESCSFGTPMYDRERLEIILLRKMIVEYESI